MGYTTLLDGGLTIRNYFMERSRFAVTNGNTFVEFVSQLNL